MNFNLRFIKTFLSSIFIFLAFVNNVFAVENQPSAHIIFINQVRGEECCDKGSLDILKKQISKFIETNISSYFVLRYDALKDENYLNYIKTISSNNPDIIKLGLLLEITPEFAQDSEINYHGSKDKWYEAQNIFSIGYSLDENKKMMDTIFGKFYQEFGYYPELTSSWMIETQTLNYIHEKYKVKIHQITRDQWQTDSYTLYGGPPHYPYPASRNWAFIPDYDRPNAPLIVRQTIADPLYNYGDNTNAFTSQPNDYMRDKKTFDYFRSLIDQAIHQPQKGFALLGLENSMNVKFNNEYLKQIDYAQSLVSDRIVIIPDINEMVSYWPKQKITIYQGKDLAGRSDDTAYWITTPQYRARLRLYDENLSLTDFRVFNKDYLDPYTDNLAKKQGFWIVPYIIDGSHGYLPIEKKTSPVQNIVFDVKNDSNLDIASIKLPRLAKMNNSPKIVYRSDKISMEYQSQRKNSTNISFQLNDITVNCPACKEIQYDNHNPTLHPITYEKKTNGFLLKWIIDNKISHELSFLCEQKKCKFIVSSDSSLIKSLRVKQYPYLFPEPINRKISVKNTVVLVNNQYAIAGRNPIRLIVIPRDIYNIPIKISESIEVISKQKIDFTINNEGLMHYIDIVGDQSASFSPTIQIDGKQIKNVTVYFSPDCKNQIKKCLTEPSRLWWYLNSLVGDKYRLIFLGEKQ